MDIVTSDKLKIKTMIENELYSSLPEIVGTGEILEDYSKTGKKRKWAEHKQSNLVLHKLYKKALTKEPRIITKTRLRDLKDCAERLEFAVDENGSKKLKHAFFCRVRLCPVCQWRRSLKLFGQVSKITDYIAKNNDTIRFLFLTFTQRNVTAQELGQCLDDVNTAFKLVTLKGKKFSKVQVLQKNLLGYIKSTEITYNSKENTFHPHLHCVFAVNASYFKGGSYISQQEWREIWQSAMKLDYLPQVNAIAIKKTEQEKAVAELAKYPAKVKDVLDLPEDVAIDILTVLTNVCRKRRFVSFGGLLKDVRKKLRLQDIESKNLDLIGADEEVDNFNAVARVIYKYNAKFGVYIN